MTILEIKMASTQPDSISWDIERYGRHLNPEKTFNESLTTLVSNGTWKYFESSNENMKIILKDHSHLIVTHGKTILESHLILNEINHLTGAFLDDSLLFMHRSGQDGLQHFRVKFSGDEKGRSASELCLDCVTVLSKIFSIKQISFSNGNDQIKEFENINPDKSLNEMAEIIKKKDISELKEAYQNSNLPLSNVKELLELCLADPNFPAFVEQVEKKLEPLSDEDDIDTFYLTPPY